MLKSITGCIDALLDGSSILIFAAFGGLILVSAAVPAAAAAANVSGYVK